MFLWMWLVILRPSRPSRSRRDASTDPTGYASATFLDSKKKERPTFAEKYVGTSGWSSHCFSAKRFHSTDSFDSSVHCRFWQTFYQPLGMVTWWSLTLCSPPRWPWSTSRFFRKLSVTQSWKAFMMICGLRNDKTRWPSSRHVGCVRALKEQNHVVQNLRREKQNTFPSSHTGVAIITTSNLHLKTRWSNLTHDV